MTSKENITRESKGWLQWGSNTVLSLVTISPDKDKTCGTEEMDKQWKLKPTLAVYLMGRFQLYR